MKRWQMREGPIVRGHKYQKAYDRYRASRDSRQCQFCDLQRDLPQVVRMTRYFWVIDNIFPYHIWDGSLTGRHMMLIPKRHVDSIAHFLPKERVEYVKLLAEFESNGYSIYARAAQNNRKSVPHQHTHLIEVGRSISTQIYLKKPFINIVK